MKAAERRISQLERQLKREKETNRGGTNDYKIGYTEFELSQLYKLSGVSARSSEMLEDALSILQGSTIVRGKKKEKLLNLVKFYKNNPTAPPLVELPNALKYLGPIILLVGYVSGYVFFLNGMISYGDFFIFAGAVLVVSMISTSVTSSYYVRRIQREYVSRRSGDFLSSASGGVGVEKTSDDILDDARAELSLASMFYTTKNFAETRLHMDRARKFLTDPLAGRSEKQERAMLVLNDLEDEMKGKGARKRKGLYAIF